MKLGIVGLPNVGKSTLFNAITQAGAESANYPFCTIEPNVGVVSVPDKRLDVLEKMYNTKKKVYTAIEFYDIGAFVWFARIIEWEFVGFSVDACYDRLLNMHQKLLQERGII